MFYVTDTIKAAAAPTTGDPSPTNSWQWKRDGVPIENAVANSYITTEADIGSNLNVTQTATNMVGKASAESASLGPILSYNPITLFRNNEQGVWYDPSDMSTMFQDAAGATPVTGMEQPVGLILDKSRGLGPELVTNGTFDTNISGWIASPQYPSSSVVEWVNGALHVYNTQANYGESRSAAIPLTIGKRYVLEMDILAGTTANYWIIIGSSAFNDQEGRIVVTSESSGTSPSGYKRWKYFFIASYATAYLYFATNKAAGSHVYAENISVRELPGNHATQSTSISRPTLSARYNLLTNTENISLFSATNATISGSIFTVTAAGAANVNRVYSIPSQLSEVSFTTSVKLKRVNANWIAVQVYNINNAIGVICYVNLGAGVLGTTNAGLAGGTVRLIPIAGEANAYRLSMTFPSNYAFTSPHIFVRGASADGNLNCVGGESYEVSQFDLRAANDGNGLPVYQRVGNVGVNQADYDTVGFPPYLRFNGSDSWLSTASIDFTGTDKMTVFAGVRKLSDSTRGMLVELSASAVDLRKFVIDAPLDSTKKYRAVLAGDGLINPEYAYTSMNFSAPDTSILTAIFNRTLLDNSVLVRADGGLSGSFSSPFTFTDTFGNYPLYIGRRGGTSIPFNGRIYSLIIRGAQSRDDQIIQTEKFVASKTGINYVMPTIDYLVSEDNNILNTEDSNRIII